MVEQDLRAAMRPSGWRVGAFSFDLKHFTGALLAVMVLGGSTYWVADLVSRDVSGVPVVLALNGTPLPPDAPRVAEAPAASDPAEVPGVERATDSTDIAGLDPADLAESLEGATFTSASSEGATGGRPPERIVAPAPLRVGGAEAGAVAPLTGNTGVDDEIDRILPEGTVTERAERGAVAVSPRPARRPVAAARVANGAGAAPQPAGPASAEDATRRAILDALGADGGVTVLGEDGTVTLDNIAFTNSDPANAEVTQETDASFRILPALVAAEALSDNPLPETETALAQADHVGGPADLVCIPKDIVESY